MKLARILALGSGALLVAAVAASAQSPTPTPVNSNITVSTYAQTHGIDLTNTVCPYQGGNGCGGCYPEGIPPSDPVQAALAQLTLVDPEWAPIGPMISGVDPSLSPNAHPVLVPGTIGLSKSPGDDFPGSHLSADYNAEIIPDDNGRLGTGNSNGRVEFEWEGDKFPLFAWAGENDRVLALGRWIFDCGHPFPGPEGTCSNSSASCIVDADCGGLTCNLATGQCSNSPGACTSDADCGPTCVGANFGYSSEMHPPQAVVMLRNYKSLPASHRGRTAPAIPASQADVFVSSDGGGAGDRCTVTHLASPASVLLTKKCFLNHCSITTARSCLVDSDCAHGETCIRLDPAQRLANINANDFTFDMPLPPAPPSPTPATLEIRTQSFKPRGGIMPKPTFGVTPGPTPNLHVVIPMTEPLPNGEMPNVFAGRIRAGWKQDTTALTHVQVKFKSLTINNPLKDSTPPIPRVCTKPTGGLSATSCATDADCTAGTCKASGRRCHENKDCAKTDYCTGAAVCVGGITPGWRLWAEVNGDWIEFEKLQTLGTRKPFIDPPYEVPSPTPLAIRENYKFDEYVPPAGSIHLKVSGHSLNCLNMLFGHNLIDGLNEFGFTAGANCLQSSSHDVGKIDVTYNGPNFGTSAPGTPVTYDVTSTGGDGGTCSVTTDQLCISDADCPAGACSTTAGPCRTSADCLHCSNDAAKFCTVATQTTDCGNGNTCVAGSETCNNAETCNGTCSNNPSLSCHADADCGAGNTCDYGGAFTLEYTIAVIP